MSTSRASHLDVATVRALELHEMRAQAGPRRSVRELGDAILLSDPLDADPFVNRAGAIRFPSQPRAFERRLDELTVLFAVLGRRAHVWSSPLGGEPDDLPRRLLAAGFELASESRLMALEGSPRIASEPPPGTRLRRVSGPLVAGTEAACDDAASVLAAAFPGADEHRLSAELAQSLGEVGRAIYLVDSVAEGATRPVAVARVYARGGLAYLSSIGTLPEWRGQGIAGALVAAAIADGIARGVSLVHLSVDDGSAAAGRLYARLGFRPVGRPIGRFLAW